MRWLATLLALVVAGAAFAKYDNMPAAARLTFSVLSSTGIVGTERACPTGVANFYQVGTDAGTLYGCDQKGEAIGQCDSLGVFTATTPAAGVIIATGKPWFRFDATTADGVGESVLTIMCSNAQIGG